LQAKEIQALIGTFALDPNRIIGCILDVYEQNPHTKTYGRLLGILFRETDTTQILGFRFHAPLAEKRRPSRNLFIVTAYLIKVG
jgi:hypothetical protein